MTYELAKKLKDAGFPQKGTNYFQVQDGSLKMFSQGSPYGDNRDSNQLGTHQYMPGWREEDVVYIPTLSELIEACGDRFDSLEKTEDIQEFEAYGDEYFNGVGSTPEEAVANLWLALNEKK